MRAIILLASFALSSAAMAQTSVESLLDRLNSVDPGVTTEADCERQVAQAATLNALDLLYGASVCFAVRKPVEGSFLLNAGQMRSSADMTLMVPAARADSEVIASLYGVIFFHAGGPGDEGVLRDAASRERFFQLFDSWSAEYPVDYNPGWNTRRRPDAAAYQALMAEVKAGRRQQLSDIVRLYSDEAYYSLHRRFQDLQARNPNGFVEGTPDAGISQDLTRQMDERSAALGIGSRSTDADDADLDDARFPPAVPARDEVVISSSADPMVQRCADMAEWHTIAADARIARVLITRSPEWGILWRADIVDPNQSTTRFTCSSNASSSRPLDLGDERIPPLPEGGPVPAVSE